MPRSMKNTEGVTEVTSVKEAVKTASKNKDSSKVYVIGGENIYKEFLPIAHRMVLTEVELNIEDGDTFFPEWSISEWQEQSRDEREENGIKFSFVEYTRN